MLPINVMEMRWLAAKTREEIKIELDDDFKKLLADGLESATANGFVKAKLDPATLVP